MKDRVFLLVAYFIYWLRDSLRLRLTIDERRNEQRNRNRMTKYRQPIDVTSRIAVKSGKARGFTLVELLVVMAIIAMLTGMLMPALAATRRIAYRTLCRENLHSCMLAFRMYLDENKNVMPTITNMPNSVPTANPAPIYTVLKKYLSGPEALKCPADRWPEKNTSYFASEGASYQYNTFPPPFPDGPFNYQNRKIEGKGIIIHRHDEDVLVPWAEIFILRDYGDFHAKAEKTGSRMYFYADNLIADRERNK